MCIFFPSVVVTYHYFWQNLKASCKKSTKVNQETHEEESPAQNFIEFIKPIGELFKCVVNWFEGPYIEYVILHPIHRWVVMAFFLIASTVFIAFATQLQTAEEQVSLYVLKCINHLYMYICNIYLYIIYIFNHHCEDSTYFSFLRVNHTIHETGLQRFSD